MTTRKTGLAAHSSSSPPGLTRWSMLRPRLANLTVLHLCMDCRIKSGNDDVKKLSRGASSAPELCSRQRQEKVLSSKGKAERRKAHCPTNVRDKRGVRTVFSSAPTFRRSRLRHSPPASTPMAQLQNRISRGGG
ncbi:MAG: hypothetical protein WA851_12020 [Xanthobacteraceae bacterium]